MGGIYDFAGYLGIILLENIRRLLWQQQYMTLKKFNCQTEKH